MKMEGGRKEEQTRGEEKKKEGMKTDGRKEK